MHTTLEVADSSPPSTRAPLRSWMVTAFGVLAVCSGAWRFVGAPAYHQWIAARPEAVDPVFRFRALVGDRVHHTFTIVNRGRSSVKITGIASDCGCTTVKEAAKGRTLMPGQSIQLPVEIHLTSAAEEFTKRVYVTFDSGPLHDLELRCEGIVHSPWVATPPSLEFLPGDRSKEAQLVPATELVLRPVRVSVNHPDLTAELAPAFDDRSWTIRVSQQAMRTSERLAAGLFIEPETDRPPQVVPIDLRKPARGN